MTREEAIINLEKLIALFHTASEQSKMVDYSKIIETLEFAAAALRPVSRERVEKAWTAEWTVDEFGHKCSKCGEYLPDGEDVRKPQFCPECGRAMTDEAVQMVIERLEALHNG